MASSGQRNIRLHLTISRHNQSDYTVLFDLALDSNPTTSKLLELVNDKHPLEDEENGWGLEDYVVEVHHPTTNKPAELVHYQDLNILRDDEIIVIRPLLSDDLKRRRVSGRHQIAPDGRRLYDGVPYGRPLLKRPRARPTVHISPRKRRRVQDIDNRFVNLDDYESEPLQITNGEEDEESRPRTPPGWNDAEEEDPYSVKIEQEFVDTDEEEEDDDGDFEPDEDEDIEDEDEDIEDELRDLQEDAEMHEDHAADAHSQHATPDAQSQHASEDENPEQHESLFSEESEDSDADEPLRASHVALRSAFPDATAKRIDKALKKKKGNPRKAYRKLLKKYKATMEVEAMLQFCSGTDVALAAPIANDNPEMDLDDLEADGDDEEEEEEEEVDALTKYYDSHGFPPGSIMGGTALNHMAAAMGNHTRLDEEEVSEDEADGNEVAEAVTEASSHGSDEESGSSLKLFDTEESDEDSDSGPEVESAKKGGIIESMEQDVDDSETSSSGTSSEGEEDDDETSSSGTSSEGEDSESDSEDDDDDDGARITDSEGGNEAASDDESSEESGEENEASSGDEIMEDGGDSSSDSEDEQPKQIEMPAAPAQTELPPVEDHTSPPESNVAKFVGIPGSGKAQTKNRNKRRRAAAKAAKAAAKAAAELSSSNHEEKGNDHELLERKQALLDKLAAEPKISEASPNKPQLDGQTEDASTSQPAESPSQPRMRLDMSAGRRHIFGALGLRNPKTKADEDKIRADLMKDVRPYINPRLQEESTEGDTAAAALDPQPVKDDDPDAWQDKITYSAKECSQEGVELSEPPFPFEQRWDPQQRGHGGGAAGKRGGKKKRKQRDRQDYYDEESQLSNKKPKFDESHDASWSRTFDDQPAADADITLNYDEDATEPIEPTKSSQDMDIDDLPALPDDITLLPALALHEAHPGMIITWKEMLLSKATNWQPEIVSRTAEVAATFANGSSLSVVLARRDREQREFDEDGQRVYDRFEAPDDDEDDDGEDDGCRDVNFADLQDPRVLRPSTKSLITVHSDIAPTSPFNSQAPDYIPFSDPFEPVAEEINSADMDTVSSPHERSLLLDGAADAHVESPVNEDIDMFEPEEQNADVVEQLSGPGAVDHVEEAGELSGEEASDGEMSDVESSKDALSDKHDAGGSEEEMTTIPESADPENTASIPVIEPGLELDSFVPESDYDQIEASELPALPELASVSLVPSTSGDTLGESAKSTTLTNGASNGNPAAEDQIQEEDDHLDSPSRQLEEMSEAAMNASAHTSRDVSHQPDASDMDEDEVGNVAAPASPQVMYPVLPAPPSSASSLRSGRQLDFPDLANDSFNIIDDDIASGTPKKSSEDGKDDEDEKTPTKQITKKSSEPSSAKSASSLGSLSSIGEIYQTCKSRITQSTQGSTKVPTVSPWEDKARKVEDEKDKEYQEAMRRIDEADASSEENRPTPVKKSPASIKKSSTQLSPGLATIRSYKKSVSPPALPKTRRRSSKPPTGFEIPAGTQVVSLLTSSPEPEENYADSSVDENWGSMPSGPGWVSKKNSRPGRGVSLPAASQGRRGSAGVKKEAATRGAGRTKRKSSFKF